MAQKPDIQDILDCLQPLSGQVLPIRTVQEVKPPEEFGDAYVAEVNIKSASKVIKALDAEFPRDSSLPSVNHLRRFAKRGTLPDQVRAQVKPTPDPKSHTIFVLITPPCPELDALKLLLAPFVPVPAPLPADANASVPETELPEPEPATVNLHSIRVPLLPPLNHHQAEIWTKTLWPVTFNPSAPRATVAPPPQVVNRAQESIASTAGHYMALAEKVAEEAEQSGRGRRVGAVVVDPAITERIIAAGGGSGAGDEDNKRWLDSVVAVAGDARYARQEGGAPSQTELHEPAGPNPASGSYNVDLEGGPELHALMRAVDLVASKRREVAESEHPSTSPEPNKNTNNPLPTPLETHFLSLPDPEPSPSSPSHPCPSTQTPTEPHPPTEPEDQNPDNTNPPPSRIRPRAQGGYLCVDLDIYVSREPCLCCSMGMLLSRFRAVVYRRKGRLGSGGLASEPVVLPKSAPMPSGEDQSVQEGLSCSEQGDTETPQRKNYYGLHWRKELNWRALGFEFVEEGSFVDPGDVFHV